MPSKEDTRTALLEWIDASRDHKASSRDRCFTDADGNEFPTAYLMGYWSNSTEPLPASHAWIVTGYQEFVGRNAAPTYQNAVRVVRAQRRQ